VQVHLRDQCRQAEAVLTVETGEATWRAKYPGRQPSRRTITGWDQAAWAQDPRAKPDHPESPEEVAERVRLELATAGFDFSPGTRQPIRWQAISVAQVDRGGRHRGGPGRGM